MRRLHRRRALPSLMAACLMLGLPDAASAYLKLGLEIGGRSVPLHWADPPVRYHVNDTSVPNVTAGMFLDAVTHAFDQWQAVPTATITYQFAGFTTARPGESDGLSTLGFLEMPQLDRVLAATTFLVDDFTGELLESDIFFNAAFSWSTASAGQTNRYDLESIALHEIGHMSGLGHSALGETELATAGGRRVIGTDTVMFPIAFPAGTASNRTLYADDIAGISDIYPDEGFRRSTGSLSGRVTKNGRGLFGAHVAAFNPTTGAFIANFTLDDRGTFSIAGLTPGPYIVRVEPLDDADIDGFFDSAIPIDLNFRVGFYSRLVPVPKGGDSGAIEIKVTPK
jgi:hypothetical protein